MAPLVVTGGDAPKLVGPCTLVTNGTKTIAFSSAELLREAPEPLGIALTMDGKVTLPVTQWIAARNLGMGIIELGAPYPKDNEELDVVPLDLGAISATVDTRGAPSALVTIVASQHGFSRRAVPVHVDLVDGAGMSDDVLGRLASPIEAGDVGAAIDGAALFSWLPADAVLGRPPEVVAIALGITYRQKTFKPREHDPISELLGLEDLGRALPFEGKKAEEGSNALGQIAGEIKESS